MPSYYPDDLPAQQNGSGMVLTWNNDARGILFYAYTVKVCGCQVESLYDVTVSE
jgi:hypothetical protein